MSVSFGKETFTMPQAHKAGNKAVSVWLDETDRSLLKEIVASGLFKDQSDFLRKLIHQTAQENNIKIADKSSKGESK